MPFVDPFFIWIFLPVACAVYFLLHGSERERAVVLLTASAAFLAGAAGLLPVAISAWLPRHIVPLGVAIAGCHAVVLVADVRRTNARVTALTAALYLLQFPLLVAGPIVRYHDFRTQLSNPAVSIGGASYGVRRFVIGYIKVAFLADRLGSIADPVFAAGPGTIGSATAWLAAICAALQVYFVFSGYADFAIGLGRIFGFRYPENFRRPYTADSLREFWRRWNITLLTWLRDYASLPIAGHDKPTPLLFVKLVVGFVVVGWWHGAAGNALVWGLFTATLLALEGSALDRVVARAPRSARHMYVLLAVGIGWVIARAETLAAAGVLLNGMLGIGARAMLAGMPAVGWYEWTALALAVILAGPMIPSVSRWRVSVDAAATSAVMMLAATAVFLWKPIVKWGQTGVRWGSDRGRTGVGPGSGRGRTGVRPGSDPNVTRIEP